MMMDEELRNFADFQAEAFRTMLKDDMDANLVEAIANTVNKTVLATARFLRRKVWHDASELPTREEWILMADSYGHYMAGQWENDGKGFEGKSEIHAGPLSFELPLGLEGDIVKWCYIDDLQNNERGT